MAERRTKALEERDAQLAQLEDLKNRSWPKRRNMKEGHAPRRLWRRWRRRQEGGAKACHGHQRCHMRANEALKAFKAVEMMKEAEQDKKIAEFAKQKEKTLVARKVHEQAKRDEAQRRRDKMVAVMEADLLERKTDANNRMNKEAEEAQIAEDLREEMKAEERREEQHMIDRSRQQQFAIRAAEKDRLKREEMAFVEQWKVRNEQLRREEEMEKISLFQKNKTLQEGT